ncbi:hypothetical protein BDA96_07G052300 [Sorghum bicolor]|uniref:Uncharacterized protein n=2 Tax=Sorghum bicolor TaxID=4558 RepID=A0A921U9G1_SORBI|nr:hypothetical protein BDA96_07G052300 [Sorghum bicolor]OQU79946.1 hypothetical protein SORBI_3007G049766 [Sorghum bicolor]
MLVLPCSGSVSSRRPSPSPSPQVPTRLSCRQASRLPSVSCSTPELCSCLMASAVHDIESRHRRCCPAAPVTLISDAELLTTETGTAGSGLLLLIFCMHALPRMFLNFQSGCLFCCALSVAVD